MCTGCLAERVDLQPYASLLAGLVCLLSQSRSQAAATRPRLQACNCRRTDVPEREFMDEGPARIDYPGICHRLRDMEIGPSRRCAQHQRYDDRLGKWENRSEPSDAPTSPL